MRLTLRTLLAYLDHVLDSNDARELESKIRESKLARHTMERIDKGLANQNAAAPSASEQDPNVLAEYLDNMLPPEQVPQFERLCFENDAHLIEAASVHRILSVVVTRPVHVSKALTTRLKDLAASSTANGKAAVQTVVALAAENAGVVNTPASAVSSTSVAAVESNGHASAVRIAEAGPASVSDSQTRTVASIGPHGLDMSDRQTNAVPEYLKGRSDAVYFQAAIAALLLVAIGLVAWVSVGPFDELSNLFKSKPVILADAIDKAEAANKSVKANVKDTPIVADTVVPPLTEKTSSTAPRETPVVEKAAEKSNAIIETADVAPPSIAKADKDVASQSVTDVAIVEENVAPPSSSTPAPETASIPDAPIATDVATSNVAPPVPATVASVPEPVAKSPIIWQPENKDSSSAVVMALTIDDLGKRSVRLVNISESLPLKTRLIVPDSYRTELRVSPGLKWVVSSATDLQGDGGEDPTIAYVRMRLGRALLHATADCSKAIVKVGVEEFKIAMDSPTAIASIEVRYFPMPGAKIDVNQLHAESVKQPHLIPNFLIPVISVASIAGNIQVQSKYGVSWSDPVTCEPGAVLAFVNGQQKGPHVLAELPWWYRTSIERPIDAGAANDLALELQAAPAEVPTGEEATAVTEDVKKEDLLDILAQSTHARRSETAALAARTLALLGSYDSIFGKDAVMSVASSRPHRTLVLDSLIQSLGVGPSNAASLIAVMSNYDPPRGTRLLSILSLPSAKELTKPEGAQPYIDALSSSYLDERAVAIYQLTKITGKEFAYQADRVTSESLSNWRKIFASGRIEWNIGSIKPLEWDTNQ